MEVEDNRQYVDLEIYWLMLDERRTLNKWELKVRLRMNDNIITC
jgi:hypothetical protein